MTEKKYQYHQIAEHSSELSFNGQGIAVVEVKGKKLCLARHQEVWYAFAYKCPYEDQLLLFQESNHLSSKFTSHHPGLADLL